MVDPVEHLRAAALSTLKGKRRKQVPEMSTPPTRPPASAESFQLDYGLGENNNSDTKTADKQISKSPRIQKGSKSSAVDEEGQPREEGEISDEEEPPSMQDVAPRHKMSTPSRIVTSTEPESMTVVEQTSRLPIVEPTLSYKTMPQEGQPLSTAPTLLERLSEPAYHSPTFKQEEEDHFDALMEGVPDLRQESRFPFGFVDPEHVRPGLALTQAEYDTVKDIILDLLGWGIPFDYFIESGINPAVLYYVFSELNLRLPDNIDMSGIIPYTPETIAQLQQNSSLPIHPPTLSGQRQLSNEQEIGSTTDLLTRLKTPPSSVMVSVPLLESPIDSKLHDMERQRRQELMARKAAVQASRRVKQSNHVESSIAAKPVISENFTMSSIIPSETVEDFLKSLEPVQELMPSQVDIALPEPNQSHGEMEVDSTPGRVQEIEWDSRKSLDQSIPLEQSFSEPPPSSAEPPPTSVASTTTTFSITSEEAFPTTMQVVPPVKAPFRRGTKRPVASDFVDFDSSPRKHSSVSRIERPNGNSQPSGITRRLNAGATFHNIGVSRRCVIDLSDSEDDDEHYPPVPQPQQRVFEEPTWQRKEVSKRQSLYPSPVPFKPSDAMSPAALAQKELEIRKMRELIARREEETRLRKLAMAKSQSNSKARTPLATTSVSTAPLKAEDVDVAMAVTEQSPTNGQAPKNFRDPKSATSSPGNSGISSFEDGNDYSAGVSETSHGTEIPQIFPKADQHLDLTVENQKTRVPVHSESAPERPDLVQPAMMEGSVDAESNPSPSTQMEPSSTMISSALQKQEEKSPGLTQPTSSSNELEPRGDLPTFSVYRSPFVSYPRLRAHPHRTLSDQISISRDFSSASSQPTQFPLSSDPRIAYTKPFSSSSSSSTDFQVPDLKPLKLASTVKLLDPLKRICQYEIPGGGTCCDEHCEDIHLNRLESANQLGIVEPSDEDAAQYLFDTMPGSWLKQRQVNSPSRIFTALQQVHQRTLNTPLSFEERVVQALSSIGSPPTS